MSNHRRQVRPRYGRIAALATSVTVCSVAALAGLGVLATSSAQAGALAKPASYTSAASDPVRTPSARTDEGSTSTDEPPTAPLSSGTSTSAEALLSGASADDGSPSGTQSSTTVPLDSGSGRRIVFSQSSQRVWLMGARPDDVQRTYLVSGSVTHNLQPGTYAVYSRSRWAVGVDDSGVMQYFVRFTQGPTGAAIGFHSIPTKNGVPLQTRAQLGTAQSHGCIRQYLPDAIALWNFAPERTKVVVVP
jgi:lipoprotein-anchoring transpeptidase ErfK/SrfK